MVNFFLNSDSGKVGSALRACYCAQLDKLDEALKWLDAAYAVGDRASLLQMAHHDPDLEPLKVRGHLK